MRPFRPTEAAAGADSWEAICPGSDSQHRTRNGPQTRWEPFCAVLCDDSSTSVDYGKADTPPSRRVRPNTRHSPQLAKVRGRERCAQRERRTRGASARPVIHCPHSGVKVTSSGG